MTPGVAIVGCGAIGARRAAALGSSARLACCADLDERRAIALAAGVPGAVAVSRWEEAVARPDVAIVIVATTNDALAPVTGAALRAGKHVLVEKPAARSVAEIDPVLDAARESGRLVRVGFNHRYHPALRQAREIVNTGALGSLMFVRGRYGHGGRVGYDREWRADPVRAGGGELIDQGVHLIDLAGWFLGPFTGVDGVATTCFWDMAVDDNAFLTLRTASGQIAFLHVSCTEWKNLFSLEVYGRVGKLAIDGLGGSYGVERLTWYRMLPEMGPPETTAWEYPRADRSWHLEFQDFLDDIRMGRTPEAGLEAARSALAVVDRIYERSGYRSGAMPSPAGDAR
jgi:predicted dehydrogenase